MHLWTLRTGEAQDDAGLARAAGILCADERAAARRLQRGADREAYIMAHALARLALSCHFPVRPRKWRFARAPLGRPFIAAPQSAPAAGFSISHTRGLVACLIAPCAEAAVDVEAIEFHADLALLSATLLAPAERKAMSALSGEDWTARFFDYWTLKEAYAKARGFGLGLAFRDIGFDLDAPGTIGVQLGGGLGDDASTWRFWQRRVPPRHTIAVAARIDRDPAAELVVHPVRFDGAGIAPAA